MKKIYQSFDLKEVGSYYEIKIYEEEIKQKIVHENCCDYIKYPYYYIDERINICSSIKNPLQHQFVCKLSSIQRFKTFFSYREAELYIEEKNKLPNSDIFWGKTLKSKEDSELYFLKSRWFSEEKLHHKIYKEESKKTFFSAKEEYEIIGLEGFKNYSIVEDLYYICKPIDAFNFYYKKVDSEDKYFNFLSRTEDFYTEKCQERLDYVIEKYINNENSYLKEKLKI